MIAQPYLIAFETDEARQLLSELEDIHPGKRTYPSLDELRFELLRNLTGEEADD